MAGTWRLQALRAILVTGRAAGCRTPSASVQSDLFFFVTKRPLYGFSPSLHTFFFTSESRALVNRV
jgi:hypothetical protein